MSCIVLYRKTEPSPEVADVIRPVIKDKNASHTRYRALGPELIPVYSQSVYFKSHIPGGRLPLLSARPTVTFPAAEHHRPLAGTKLYCLVTEAHRCEQLAQDCYAAFAPSRIWIYDLLIASPTLYSFSHRATQASHCRIQTVMLSQSERAAAAAFRLKWYFHVQLAVHTDDSCGVGVLPPFVSVSVYFSARYLKNRCRQDHQTWRRNVPRRVLEVHFFWGQKVNDLRSRVAKSLPSWVFALLWVLTSSSSKLYRSWQNIFFLFCESDGEMHTTPTEMK